MSARAGSCASCGSASVMEGGADRSALLEIPSEHSRFIPLVETIAQAFGLERAGAAEDCPAKLRHGLAATRSAGRGAPARVLGLALTRP